LTATGYIDFHAAMIYRGQGKISFTQVAEENKEALYPATHSLVGVILDIGLR